MMNHSRFAGMLIILAIGGLLVTGSPVTATGTDELAKYLCDISGVSRGICAMPRAGDGALALTLAQSGLLVHAMDADVGKVAHLRQDALQAIPNAVEPPSSYGLWTVPTVAGHKYEFAASWLSKGQYGTSSQVFEILDMSNVDMVISKQTQRSAPADFTDNQTTSHKSTIYWNRLNTNPVTAAGNKLYIRVSAVNDGMFFLDAIRIHDITTNTTAYQDDQDGSLTVVPASALVQKYTNEDGYLGTLTLVQGSGTGPVYRAIGVLGKTLYAECGTPAEIPFADSYVNLLVVDDATDANLSALPMAEMQRVLIYGIGKAIVGLPSGASGTLTKAKLSLWAKGFTGATYQIVQDSHGLWAIITRNAQAGAVPWTHRLFSPANNVVTSDTACAWPLMTQWLGRPYQVQQPIVLVVNGRMAIVSLDQMGWGSWLDMRDAHNGLLLWRRGLPDSKVASRTSGIVLSADALYLAEGPNVLILDPVNGKELGRVDCHELGAQVKWIALEAGALYVMAGSLEGVSASSVNQIAWLTIPKNFARASALGVFDLATKQWRWRKHETEDSLDDSMVGLAHGRLYYYVDNKSFTCCDANTGKEVWNNPTVVEKIKAMSKGIAVGHPGAVICNEKYVVVERGQAGALIMAAATGAALWQPTTLPAAPCLALWKDLVLRKSSDPVVDIATGKPLPAAFPAVSYGAGCSMFTLSPNLFCGQCGITYDLKGGKPLDVGGYGPIAHKGPCMGGSFVAEGMNVSGAHSCHCGYAVRGTVVLENAATLPPAGKTMADQLRHANTAPEVMPFPVTSADWPTFRANNARGNATTARLPEKMSIAWSWAPTPATPSGAPPAPPDMVDSSKVPVQVSAAGSLVFVPGSDGVVTALEVTTGVVKWRFISGGRLFAPPTIADDRCFIGSGDGYVYCLEAASGRELWRYRVAPLDRRIMIYGDLLSTWAITGGVLEDHGVIYAIAGILDIDNTYVVALDAKTGAVKWRNDSSGHLDAQRNSGVSAMGYPAIGAGHLWIRNASYDLATGVCQLNVSPKGENNALPNALFQRYTGYFANAFLLSGGSRFFDDQNKYSSDQANDTAYFMELNADASGKYPIAVPWGQCRVLPAWDERNTIAMPGAFAGQVVPREVDLLCWDTPRAVAALHITIAPKGQGDMTPRSVLDHAKGQTYKDAQQVWCNSSGWYMASVLTANVVVATHALPDGQPNSMSSYVITAYNRTTGAPLWQVSLPGQPLMDGLSIAGDGSVLVRLLDGRVVCLR